MERSDSGDVDVQASAYLQTDETHERDDAGEALVCNSDHEIDVVINQNEQRKSEQEEEFDEHLVEGKEFDPPALGMEFESYDDAYNYYNCYANEVGFRVRVKNSWFKRRSKEKYGAVLCCSSQGFKRANDANNRVRKETRTGCPAMVRMRQVDSKRWRVVEVALDHNHTLGDGSKMMMVKRTKRKCTESDSDAKTVHKVYRARVMDSTGNGAVNRPNSALKKQTSSPDVLNLRRGDSTAVYNYFVRMQLTNPNFFYLMDLNDEGQLRNVFWADSFSRASCIYFSDVIFVDNSYISGKFEIPLVTLVGVNHHGQTTLLGCGLLAGETVESYHWLLRVWLGLMKCSPQTIVTDRCKPLESAVSQVFPRCLHRFSVACIMRRVPEKLGGLVNYDGVRKALTKAVYETLKVVDFEAAWGFMVHSFGVVDNEWLRSLYDDRAKWAPVYLIDTFFAGLATCRPGESLSPFFERYVHRQTPLREFLDKYELALYRKRREETLAELESLNFSAATEQLKTKCSFETQLSRVYTRDVFKKFQVEVEEMYSCFSTTQVHVEGPLVIFLVKERVQGESNRREVRDFEVLYNRSVGEVRCICSCFSFYGYLCRHALCVLNFNGVEEIPLRYVLPRWRRDYRRVRAASDNGFVDGGGTDRVQRFDQLYKGALEVVEEGAVSLDRYKVAMQVLEQGLDRVHSVEEKQE